MADSSAPNPDRIFQVGAGYMASKYLLTANELGVFSALGGGPLTLDELSSALGIEPHGLRIVVDALVTLAFLAKQNGRYQNGADAQAFLSGRGPADLRPILRYWSRCAFPYWVEFERSVRENRAVTPGALPSEEDNRVFSEGVEALTAREARALPDAFDFSARKRVLNIGGWYVSFLLPLLERHPALEATLFMLPQWRMRAEHLLAQTPSVSGRVSLDDGDYLFDPLPTGHDVVLLTHILHHMSPNQARTLLAHVRSQSDPGAIVIGIDYFMNDDRTSPPLGALLAGQFLLTSGTGDVYSVAQATAFFSGGYRLIGHRPLFGASSMIVAEVV